MNYDSVVFQWSLYFPHLDLLFNEYEFGASYSSGVYYFFIFKCAVNDGDIEYGCNPTFT